MTNLEALQSLVEYTNSNLFTKVLLDNGITGSATYAATEAQGIDLSLADIYLYLAQHPDLTEGKFHVKYDPVYCMSARADLYSKWGLTLPEVSNGSKMSGTKIW